MAEDEARPDDGPDDANMIKQFRQQLAQSGGGGGVSLRFDAETARQFKLDSETEVDVRVCEEEGDVYFKIGAIPAGFTAEDFEGFAERRGWEKVSVQRYDDGEWYLTYTDPYELVTIRMNTEARIDESSVNNVSVSGPPVEVADESLENYRELCVAAVQKGLDVRIDDSAGLWGRLKASVDHETDDAPSTETFEQLVREADTVTIQLVSRMASVHTTLDEVAEAVADIQSAMAGVIDIDVDIDEDFQPDDGPGRMNEDVTSYDTNPPTGEGDDRTGDTEQDVTSPTN